MPTLWSISIKYRAIKYRQEKAIVVEILLQSIIFRPVKETLWLKKVKLTNIFDEFNYVTICKKDYTESTQTFLN